MTSIRLPVSFFLSVLTTVALFWFLGMLVAAEPRGEFIPTVPGIDFTTLIPETEPIHIIRVPPPIPKPVRPPDTPVVTVDPPVIDGNEGPGPVFEEGSGGGLELPPIEGPQDFTMRTGTDRAPVPQIRVDPDYPTQLRDHGIEGWVTFQFTVTANGRVKDVVVLASDPPRVWDATTIRAVSSWKYQPAIKDGRPVEQVGVRATYRFELER